MAKVKKDSIKAIQNRNRVNFHRRCKSILNNDNELINTIARKSILVREEETQSESENESDNEHIQSTEEKLRSWVFKHNITKSAVSDLLKILISIGMTWLPKDSRTFTSTPRNVNIATLTNGHLW